MIMLFEDKESTGISQLLTYAYSKTEGFEKYVYFANGNRNICNKIKEIRQSYKDRIILVYIDVVPGKEETIAAYYDCIDWVKDNKDEYVYIIPIPCIEYYVVKAFFDKSLLEVQTVTQLRNFRDVKYNYKGKELSTEDFESYCKSVVKNYKSCFKNKGNFYHEDYLCSVGIHLNDCESMEIMNKAWRLVGSLPIFVYSKSNKYVNSKHVDISEVAKNCKEKYLEVAKRYTRYNIIEDIESLDDR